MSLYFNYVVNIYLPEQITHMKKKLTAGLFEHLYLQINLQMMFLGVINAHVPKLKNICIKLP
jgi:hypothetical protein